MWITVISVASGIITILLFITVDYVKLWEKLTEWLSKLGNKSDEEMTEREPKSRREILRIVGLTVVALMTAVNIGVNVLGIGVEFTEQPHIGFAPLPDERASTSTYLNRAPDYDNARGAILLGVERAVALEEYARARDILMTGLSGELQPVYGQIGSYLQAQELWDSLAAELWGAAASADTWEALLQDAVDEIPDLENEDRERVSGSILEIAEIYAEIGDYPRAVEAVERGAALLGEDAALYYNKALYESRLPVPLDQSGADMGELKTAAFRDSGGNAFENAFVIKDQSGKINLVNERGFQRLRGFLVSGEGAQKGSCTVRIYLDGDFLESYALSSGGEPIYIELDIERTENVVLDFYAGENMEAGLVNALLCY